MAKVIAIILVFNACNNVQAEKDKSPGFIYLMQSRSIRVNDSKRRYLLQKLHTVPYQFDGNGFFFITYGTLVGVRLRFELFTYNYSSHSLADWRSDNDLHGLLLPIHERF